MVREIFSLLGYLAGYILAINYNEELATALQDMVMQEIMARIAGFAIIFIVVKIAVALIIFFTVKVTFGLLGRLIRRFIDGTTALSLPDRILGGCLGIFKGLIIVAVIMFPLALFENSYKKVTQGSVLAPYFEKFIYAISQETYEKNLIDKLPKLSIDDFKKTINKMSDVESLTQEIKSKKDDLLKMVKGAVLKEKNQEKYTDKDKSELNDLLNTLSKE